MSVRVTRSRSRRAFSDMDKFGSSFDRMARRLAAMGPAGQQGTRPALVRVGDDDGGKRALIEFVPATRRFHGAAPSILSIQPVETPEYVRYWRAIMLRKWAILAVTLVVCAITAAQVFRMSPVYRSTATLLIETDTTKLVPIGDGSGGIGAYYREYYQTQAEVLKSHEVAQLVFAKLKLAANPEFAPRQNKPGALETWVGEHFPAVKEFFWPPRVLDQPSVEGEVFRRYAERLTIEPVDR